MNIETDKKEKQIQIFKHVIARYKAKLEGKKGKKVQEEKYLSLIKLEYLAEKKKLLGIYETALTDRLTYKEAFQLLRLEIGKIHDGYTISKIEKIYIYTKENVNSWHLTAKIKIEI